MRCTRCQKPVVPQAVGVTPSGVFVFGWCVACLVSSGCGEIAVADRRGRPSTRLILETSKPRPYRAPRPRDPLSERRRLAAGVCLLLGVWGLVFMAVGFLMRTGVRARGPSPMMIGGGATAAVGFWLWWLNSGLVRTRRVFGARSVQALAFGVMIGTVAAGVVSRTPRHGPLIVGVVAAALLISAVARWVDRKGGRRRFEGL